MVATNASQRSGSYARERDKEREKEREIDRELERENDINGEIKRESFCLCLILWCI